MPKTFWIFFFLTFSTSFALAQRSNGDRGVDFRMQFVSGNLDFTNISGIPRKFNGAGSELQTSLYLMEKTRFRANLFISSRVMTWAGQDVVDEEYDDLQTFSVAPGFELQYGPFYVQAAGQRVNANAYFISATSKGKQLIIEGPSLAGGFNYRFGHLGIGLGYTRLRFNVPGERLGLSEPSLYSEQSYSVNLIYYIGVTPKKFFRDLF
jgi:hypothetical protein